MSTGGVWIFRPDGVVIGMIALNTPSGNCVIWNGHLYITAGGID
jgi:hypothetical protein